MPLHVKDSSQAGIEGNAVFEEEPKVMQMCEKTSKVEKHTSNVGEECYNGPIVSTACWNGG